MPGTFEGRWRRLPTVGWGGVGCVGSGQEALGLRPPLRPCGRGRVPLRAGAWRGRGGAHVTIVYLPEKIAGNLGCRSLYLVKKVFRFGTTQFLNARFHTREGCGRFFGFVGLQSSGV